MLKDQCTKLSIVVLNLVDLHVGTKFSTCTTAVVLVNLVSKFMYMYY